MRQLTLFLVCLLFISTFARPQEPGNFRQSSQGHGVIEHLISQNARPPQPAHTGSRQAHEGHGVIEHLVVKKNDTKTGSPESTESPEVIPVNPPAQTGRPGPDPDPATTTTRTPAPDFHDNGQDCWYVCGKKDGPCDHFCGTDGMCCRKEWPYYGCNGKEGGDHHICVLKRKPQITDLHRPFYTGGHPMSARSSHGNGQIPPHKASKIYDLVQEIKDVFHSNRRN